MPTRMVPQISGRVVNSLDDITVQEVPTDGNISTMRFAPEASEAQPKQPSQLDIIDNRISELFDVVERIEDRLPYDVETKRSSATRRKAVKANAAE